jgi:hypothetical protein
MRYSFLYAIFIALTGAYAQDPAAIITGLSGKAEIVRSQDSIVRAAVLFDILYPGDSLLIDHGQATLLHVDRTVIMVEDSESVLIIHGPGANHDCDLPEDMNFLLISLFSIGKEKTLPIFEVPPLLDASVSYLTIYAPGNTGLSNARPDVVWSQYPGANWYAVTFQTGGETIIDNATIDTFMTCFEQHRALEPDDYLIRVFAFHNNDTLAVKECSVHVMDSSEVAIAEEQIAVLDGMETDEYTMNLLKALVYEEHSLLSCAAECYGSMRSIRPGHWFADSALASVYTRLGFPYP